MQKNITENTCRVCLSEQDILINLFDEVEDFQTKLSDLLESCGDLKVDLADNYPKLICGDCTSELLVAAKFRDKCKRTKEILSQFIPTESVCEFDVEEDEQEEQDSGHPDNETTEIDPEPELKKELIEEVEDDEDAKTDLQMEMYTTHVFEHVEFLDASEPGDHYIIFDESGKNDKESPSVGSENDESLVKVEDNQDQELYDRIINAAKTAAKYTPKQHVLAKPLIINCKCDICGAGFTHQNNLRRHLQKHSTWEVFTCSVCMCPFSNFAKLEEHEKQHVTGFTHEDNFAEKENSNEDIHSSEESPPSNVKKKTGLTELRARSTQVSNTKTISDNKEAKRTHICSHCEKGFVSKSALGAHLRIHTGDRPFGCTECTKKFTTQGGLVLHMRRHSGLRPFSCNVCGKRFVESSNLKVHMRIHTGEKPHKCTICGRSFARVFLLQIHQRTHTGERPYQCPYCEKAFAQQGDLASHKRIHTGERPHKCPYCSKGFIKSSALTQHMRKHSKFDDAIPRKPNGEENDISTVKKEGNQIFQNYDILIVEDEETMHSDEMEENDREEDKNDLGEIVECPAEVVETS